MDKEIWYKIDFDQLRHFIKELAKRQPMRAVFRDSSFVNDAVKINISELFKRLSPSTELKML